MTPSDPRFIDHTGQRFGLLTVVAYCDRKNGMHRWHCRCECGKETVTYGNNLRRGLSKSCGCMIRPANKLASTSHGARQTAEYSVWTSMRTRCLNPNSKYFRDYGGRGIKLLWPSFAQFIADMGPRPSDKHTIERIDNDGPYCKTNCRWATKYEQANNRRTTRKLTHDGKTLSIAEWERFKGLGPHIIWKRLRRGWSIASAIDTPSQAHLLTP